MSGKHVYGTRGRGLTLNYLYFTGSRSYKSRVGGAVSSGFESVLIVEVWVAADDMQESIKTIQRTLDAVFALEGSNGQYTGGHLTVNSTRPSSSASSTRSTQVDKPATTDAYRTSPLSAVPASPRLAGHRRSHPPSGHGRRYRDEAIATPTVREHVHFLKQGQVTGLRSELLRLTMNRPRLPDTTCFVAEAPARSMACRTGPSRG